MRDLGRRSGRRVQEVPVIRRWIQENPLAFEPAIDTCRGAPGASTRSPVQFGRHLDRVVGRVSRGSSIADALELAPHEDGLQSTAYGLDLGQLRHLSSLARAFMVGLMWLEPRVGATGSRRRRRLVVAVASVALVFAAASALAVGDRLLAGSPSRRRPKGRRRCRGAAPYIAGQKLHLRGRRPQRLAAPLLGPLLGMDGTLAVAAPDQQHVAYHSWRDRSPGVPLLFVHDTVSRTDRLLAAGAASSTTS